MRHSTEENCERSVVLREPEATDSAEFAEGCREADLVPLEEDNFAESDCPDR
jgi:hypothetical protein